MYNLDDIKRMIDESSFLQTKLFNEKIIPTAINIKGMKMLDIHKLSKLIYDDSYDAFLNYNDHSIHELDVMHGDIITYIENDDLRIKYLKEFVPLISNWLVLDNLCSHLKVKNKALYYPYLRSYLNSNHEYEIRFVAVLYLYDYLEDEYIDDFFKDMDVLDTSNYYAMMGVAWAIASAYPKYKDKTIEYLKTNNLDKTTHNKAISKMLDSYKISSEDKSMLKTLKRI